MRNRSIVICKDRFLHQLKVKWDFIAFSLWFQHHLKKEILCERFLWILAERRRSGTKGEPWLLRTHWAMNVGGGYKGSREQVRAHQPCTFKQKNICLCREPWRLCWLSQSWRSSASRNTTLPVSTADLWPLSAVSLSCTSINSVCVFTEPVAVDMISNVECCEAVTNKIHIPVTKVMNVMKTSGCNLEAIMWVLERQVTVVQVSVQMQCTAAEIFPTSGFSQMNSFHRGPETRLKCRVQLTCGKYLRCFSSFRWHQIWRSCTLRGF